LKERGNSGTTKDDREIDSNEEKEKTMKHTNSDMSEQKVGHLLLLKRHCSALRNSPVSEYYILHRKSINKEMEKFQRNFLIRRVSLILEPKDPNDFQKPSKLLDFIPRLKDFALGRRY